MLPMIAVYVVVTGASPSIVRAGVAGALVTVAGLASRPADLPLLILVPAAVLLTMNPWNLLDVGFQLSFAAVIGLFLLARHFVRLLRFLPRSLAETAGITAAASVATAPISLASFGQASLIGVVANVAGGFVLGPVMFCGMASVLVGLVWPAASLPLNVAAGALIAFLLSVARFCARLPFAVYQWQGVSVGFLVAAGGLALLLTAQVLAGRLGMGVLRFVLSPRRRQTAILAVATLAALALVLAPSAPRCAGRAHAHRPQRRGRGGGPGADAGRADHADRRGSVAAGAHAARPRRARHRPSRALARARRPHGGAGRRAAGRSPCAPPFCRGRRRRTRLWTDCKRSSSGAAPGCCAASLRSPPPAAATP